MREGGGRKKKQEGHPVLHKLEDGMPEAEKVRETRTKCGRVLGRREKSGSREKERPSLLEEAMSSKPPPRPKATVRYRETLKQNGERDRQPKRTK